MYCSAAAALIAAAALATGLAGCSVSPTNFSQYPGFAAHYAAHPPSDALPTAAEQTLLARYRPRFFLPPRHPGLIDFYADYIAQGTLVAGNGRVIASQVTAPLLNAHKTDPTVVFTHQPKPGKEAQPTVLGLDEAAYRLAYLPPSDAFYTFEGFLGERRRLPGRDGPPGADCNTLPPLKPLARQLLMGFWRDGDCGIALATTWRADAAQSAAM